MPGVARQTLERFQIGLALRRYRREQGRTQADIARAIKVTPSTVSKIEQGRATLTTEKLAALLDFLDVPHDEQSALLALAEPARKRQREPRPYASLPGAFQRIADMESAATAIYCYASGVVPGPLQSPGYTRALMRLSNGIFWEPSQQEIEERIAFREQGKKRLLDPDNRKRLQFVFTGDALTVTPGYEAVMREQLEHLIAIHEQRPNLTLQVLEPTIENPSAGGSITVMEFEGSRRVAFAPVVYGPSVFFDGDADTAALLQGFRRTQELARDNVATIEFLRTRLRECQR